MTDPVYCGHCGALITRACAHDVRACAPVAPEPWRELYAAMCRELGREMAEKCTKDGTYQAAFKAALEKAGKYTQ